MDALIGADWKAVLLPDTPLLEIFVRGTVMYLALFVLLRVVRKREAGGVGMTDLLVIVLLADAAQNGLAGDYRSLTDGILLVMVLIFWAAVLDWAAYRSGWMQRLLKPAPLLLVKDGQPQLRNMRREFITLEELRSQMRLEGAEELTDVREAYMEPDGRISVVTKERA